MFIMKLKQSGYHWRAWGPECYIAQLQSGIVQGNNPVEDIQVTCVSAFTGHPDKKVLLLRFQLQVTL